jgi:hypothetical protein
MRQRMSFKEEFGLSHVADDLVRQMKAMRVKPCSEHPAFVSMRMLTDQIRGPMEAITASKDSLRSLEAKLHGGAFTLQEQMTAQRDAVFGAARYLHHPMGDLVSNLADLVKPIGSIEKLGDRFNPVGSVTMTLADLKSPFEQLDEKLLKDDSVSALGRTLQSQRLCEPVPQLEPRPSPRRTVRLTVEPEPLCFLCGGPMVFAGAEARLGKDLVLRARLRVLPCGSCAKRMLRDPNYMADRLRQIADGEGNEVASGQGWRLDPAKKGKSN